MDLVSQDFMHECLVFAALCNAQCMVTMWDPLEISPLWSFLKRCIAISMIMMHLVQHVKEGWLSHVNGCKVSLIHCLCYVIRLYCIDAGCMSDL